MARRALALAVTALLVGGLVSVVTTTAAHAATGDDPGWSSTTMDGYIRG
jgi:hypothetical protein